MRALFAEHGTRSKYMAGCKCGPCVAANTAYQREWRHRRLRAGWRVTRGRFRPFA